MRFCFSNTAGSGLSRTLAGCVPGAAEGRSWGNRSTLYKGSPFPWLPGTLPSCTVVFIWSRVSGEGLNGPWGFPAPRAPSPSIGSPRGRGYTSAAVSSAPSLALPWGCPRVSSPLTGSNLPWALLLAWGLQVPLFGST